MSKLPDHILTGNQGEELACKYLHGKGYAIVYRNLKLGFYELDIVAQQANEWVVVEVKTLQGDHATYPEEAAGNTKQTRLGKAATQFAAEFNSQDWPIRFDLIAVIITPDGHLIRHYEDAFRPAFG